MTNEKDLRPRLLKEIPASTVTEIDETVRRLRTLFPSYRDDQLFVFWLGKLSQTGTDIHNFSSQVSFHQYISCENCMNPVRDDQIFVDLKENTLCISCHSESLKQDIFQSLNNAVDNGYDFLDHDPKEIAEDLHNYDSQFEDVSVELLIPAIIEWINKKRETQ